MPVDKLGAFKQCKISFAANLRRSQTIPDDENGNGIVTRYDDRTLDAGFCENHVIAFLAYQPKAIQLENTNQSAIVNRSDAGHRLGALGSRNREANSFACQNSAGLERLPMLFEAGFGKNLAQRAQPRGLFQK